MKDKWIRIRTSSVTVSYSNGDDLWRTAVGEGKSFAAALADADERLRTHCRATGLPPGEWTRRCVSTPQSIYTDLQGRKPSFHNGQLAPPQPRYGEGKVIHVASME